ncbi:sodium- and chloride-dependent glycine transporter 2-like [Onthophagus taurus]|uniref:sodium- and chloride-dependent glycine transporter 2-like n=1 Tax=Onthophagus taurus TaxID=166361 RepID=UPI000C2091D9|nr:sodium- and chloride-dependent glycine transporter 2-like [Onthophagus taurus]
MLGNGPDFLPYMICFSLQISGGLFILTYLLSAFLLAMPLIYMEIFLGRYTSLTNSQMYRMVPIFFGFGVMILLMNMFYIPINMVNTSHFFIDFLKLMIEPDLFKKCPVGSDTNLCIDGITRNKTRKSVICMHGDYLCSSGKGLKFVTDYIYWQTFKSEDPSNYPIWQLLISLIVTWIVIGAFMILGMRVIGAMLKAITIVCWVIFTVMYIMALTVSGSENGLKTIISIEYSKMNVYKCLIIAFYTIGKLGFLVPTGYMTASAYAKFPKRLGTGAETLLLVISNVFISLFFLSGMFAIGGALAKQFDVEIQAVMSPLIGLYLSLIPQFLTHMESPLSFMLCYMFFFWFIQIIRTTVVIHLIVLNLYDYLPQLSYFPNYVVMSIVGVCGVTSLICCLHFFVMLTDLLAVNYIILCLNCHVLIESFSVFCCYGVKRLCDDIHFLTGRKPMRYWSLLWYTIPFFALVSFMAIILKWDNLKDMQSILAHKKLSNTHIYAGASVLTITLLVTFASSFLFVVLSFRTSNTNLLKPQFFWGPAKREIRMSRKSFAPRTSIRSQPPRKKKQRFRVRSIKQMHEKDLAEKVKRGRIFVDTAFFRNVHLEKGKSVPLSVNEPTVIYK